MGFLISTLATQDISGSDIYELCIDKVIYRSVDQDNQDNLVALYFEKEISAKCFEILTNIKKNDGKCNVYCHQFKIMAINDRSNNYSCACSSLSPTTFGYRIDD